MRGHGIMNDNKFDYYYGNESEQFIFYRIPKVLFTDNRFKKLSTEAKVLYGLMLDRMGLSIKNQWCDDDNRVYIIYTQEESMEHLNYGNEKIIKLYKELDEIGLIERKRQGQGRPTWIYVKNFISTNTVTKNQDIGKSDIKTSEKQMSRSRKIGCADIGKTDTSNTDINKTDFNYTDINHINQSESETQTDKVDKLDKMDTYREIVKENIEYNILIQNISKDQINEIVELIVETVVFPKNSYYINNTEYPAEIVKSRFLKLGAAHVEYVIDNMKKIGSEIRNIRAYLIASLFNSFTTKDNYYTADYNADSIW